MEKMINQFVSFVEVYGVDGQFLESDDYIIRFLKDISKKQISELTINQREFLKKSCKSIVSSIIKRIKDDNEGKLAFKESLIFYRDNIKTL